MKKSFMQHETFLKRGGIMGKDTSKPISFKTVQKNKKLGEFTVEENRDMGLEEQNSH